MVTTSNVQEALEHLKAARRKVDQIDGCKFGELAAHYDKLARALNWRLKDNPHD